MSAPFQHHWIYRGPRTASCQLCGEVWTTPPDEERRPYCEPYCSLFDGPGDEGSEAEFCTDCGGAWTLRLITEVDPDNGFRPTITTRSWVKV